MRSLLAALLTFLALYLALVVAVYAFQERMVFFPEMPGRALAGSPADLGLVFANVHLPAKDGPRLHAWYVPAAPGATTVLFLHGNAGNISHRLEWLKILHELGLGVLLLEYRGYGQSGGSPSESGLYEDARRGWDYLTQTRRIPSERIVIFGESLGGSVAAHLAKDVKPAALIVSSSFTSAVDLARKFYWYLPVRLIARVQFRTAESVAQVRAPVFIIHSRDDEIVPFSHGEALYRAANDPKQFLEIEGDHNAGFLMSEAKLTAALRHFLDAHGI